MNKSRLTDNPIRNDINDLESLNFGQGTYNRRVNFAHDEENRAEATTSTAEIHRQVQQDSPERPSTSVPTQNATRSNYHHLQVLDEDAENFRAKLDNLINGFKNETMGEFMSIKRGLLQEQNQTIENETRKFNRILENRTNELDRTKETLASKIKTLERSEVIIHCLSNWSGTARNTKKQLAIIAKYFGAFKIFKRMKDAKKRAKKVSIQHFKLKKLAKFMSKWKEYHVNTRTEKMKGDHDDIMNRELAELAAKYNKEIDMLTKRLEDTQFQLDEATSNKAEMQENLKKAFMRGVCALNFEAMNVFNGKQGAEEDDLQFQAENVTNKLMQNTFGSTIQNTNNNSQNFDRSYQSNQVFQETDHQNRSIKSSPQKSNIVFYQSAKLESKEGGWRDAPIVGQTQDEPKKQNATLSSMMQQHTENKENSSIPTNIAAGRGLKETKPYEQDDSSEGKVIKVNRGGHSYVDNGSKLDAKKGPKTTTATSKTGTVRSSMNRFKK